MLVIFVFRKEIRKMTFRREAYHTIDEPSPFTEMAAVAQSEPLGSERVEQDAEADGYDFRVTPTEEDQHSESGQPTTDHIEELI
tara:strand:+ start:215 stop:466 length:252 start_codon:yes stop_codon:yes gene_type:complete